MERRVLHQPMPKNAQDAQGARELVSLGAEELAPVVPEMLRQLKNTNSPVCDIFAEFFARHGARFVNEIESHLSRSTMSEVKWVIVAKILPSWPVEALRPLRGTLGFLMSAPDFLGTDLLCVGLLAEHSLIERESLEQWLKFKRDRLRMLTHIAEEIAKAMGKTSDPQSAA